MRSFPWEITPKLTEARLRTIASTVDRVRSEALLSHEPDKGDNEWALGCRAYARTCFALCKLADTDINRDWLVVDIDGLACTLRIEGVPIKFYRGEPSEPSPRALRGLDAAVRDAATGQTNLFSFLGSGGEAEAEEWLWLMAIETHGDGSVSRVVMLQATASGEMRNDWSIPLEDNVPAVAEIIAMQREGVDLPPPLVGPKLAEQGTETAPAAAGGDVVDGSS